MSWVMGSSAKESSTIESSATEKSFRLMHRRRILVPGFLAPGFLVPGFLVPGLGYVGLMLAAVLSSSAVYAEDIACAQIENARERLACFDKQYPRDPNQPIVPPAAPSAAPPAAPSTVPPVASPAAPSTVPPAASPAAPPEPATLTNQPVAPVAAPEPPQADSTKQTTAALVESQEPADPAEPEHDQRKPRSMFQLPAKVRIESRIAAVSSEPQKKMVFRLENGQIWLQSSPRTLAIHEGADVVIRNGTIGGFIMRTGDGVSTRVQRIE